ncbi:MAG: flagellar hook capping FlgD N-terminal domain-containing protein [Clostridiaceae bacterium]|uniref:Flagellar hook capping protein n=1 Tax=Clostridium porci TaxID=2605778 RepID=A0A7X2NMC0_9CLOT|nr:MULTISPECIES: flagellar hook capping FlgD N-terminal domain-containing protein [Clostridium]MCI6138810.1 flagellar hook capping protein [Clostridium sp.]MDY3230457.1 flagellar hook capping FlgD N-terminal domain-containing protein [Clostridiaceae bacterium]MSS37383.1 flagellar hook capping protein [Clostridium porci]
MADKITASGTSNPYIGNSYTVEANDKNTITMNSYFKLLAAQLQNQDMTNPMDNSEMMAQMTQMAMVQSMSAMTESISTSTAVSTQTYAAGLVGQRVTVAVTETNAYGQDKGVDVKYGDVESVNFVGGTPVFRLKGDDKDYPLSYLLGMGEIPNPYDKKDGNEEGDKEEGANGNNRANGINSVNNNRNAWLAGGTGLI